MFELNSLFQSQHALTASLLLIALVLLFVAKRFILVRLKAMATSRGNNTAAFYPAFVMALDVPLSIITLILTLWMGSHFLAWSALASSEVISVINHIMKALFIIALFVFVERLFSHSLSRYRQRSTLVKNSSGIVSGAVRAILASLALLIILSSMGISVTPIIASLGITSLAVALALQPTLENFFSGIQLVIDKPIRIGDYIELDSGEQGFVEKIGWRSTWIRMLPNNIVIMPNSKLSDSKLINYYYPERELSVPVEVGVHYHSDLEKVEAICLEVAEHILKHHHYGVDTYEPFVLFHTFDKSSINLTVMLRTKEYFNRFFIKSAFMKMLKKRFDEEGIVIPFPITALNLDQEGAASLVQKAQREQTSR